MMSCFFFGDAMYKEESIADHDSIKGVMQYNRLDVGLVGDRTTDEKLWQGEVARSTSCRHLARGDALPRSHGVTLGDGGDSLCSLLPPIANLPNEGS
jgi:hypothetical protein